MTESKEELRPCPFCGGKAVSGIENDDTRLHATCGNQLCKSRRYGELLDTWNSAWCWKEIDLLKAENFELRCAYKDCTGDNWDDIVAERLK